MSLLRDAFETVQDTVTVPAGTSGYSAAVPAPTDKTVVGGGAHAASGQVYVAYSYPEADGSQWNFVLTNNTGSPQDIDIYATCVG